KEFIVGIAASKNVPVGSTLNFTLKATATIDAIFNSRPLHQTIEKTLQLQFFVSSDFSEIFDLECREQRREVQREKQTDYPITLYNYTRRNLDIAISTSGNAQVETNKWDYYFTLNKAKNLTLELGIDPKNLNLRVSSEIPNEITNIITAKFNWNPFLEDNPDFILEKSLHIITIFQPEPFPVIMNFRTSQNAADPGITFTLTAILSVLLTATNPSYNITLEIEGDLIFINQPQKTLQLRKNEPQTITWDVKIPENAPIGSTIPVKLSVKLDERTISSVLNIKVTNYRKDYEFSFKVDWRVLSVIQGRKGIVTATIKNIGRKPDIIKLDIKQMLPVGWYARPSHKSLSVKPDQQKSLKIYIFAPSNANLGETGKIIIKAFSKNNPGLVQTKNVTVKAARPAPKWSLQVSLDKNKKLVSPGGSSTFTIKVINNGNRPLGQVLLSVRHKYQPIQFEIKILPNSLDLRRPGAISNAAITIKPKLTGPGTYKFDIIARWQEKIMYAEDKKSIQIEYSTAVFLKSKYGLISIIAIAGLITTLIFLFTFGI
ncbi:MAG: COG1470 family protein, partial [Candidatus Helarchaeota archaeon]